MFGVIPHGVYTDATKLLGVTTYTYEDYFTILSHYIRKNCHGCDELLPPL